MPQAPLIMSPGSLARYPLGRRERFSTREVVFADFSKQVFSQLADPLGSWTLNLSLLRDDEVADWMDFFRTQKGKGVSFSFIDPWDNLLLQSEAFENAAWVKSANMSAATNATADPFGFASSRVRQLTVSATPATLSQSPAVAPGGSGNSRTKGVEFTFSLYVKSSGASPTFRMVLDDGSGINFTKSVTPTSDWVRESVTGRFAATNAAASTRVLLDTWGAAGNVWVFGAQLEVDGTLSKYKRTTTKGGLRTKCRFASDELLHTAEEFDANQIQALTIEEWG